MLYEVITLAFHALLLGSEISDSLYDGGRPVTDFLLPAAAG